MSPRGWTGVLHSRSLPRETIVVVHAALTTAPGAVPCPEEGAAARNLQSVASTRTKSRRRSGCRVNEASRYQAGRSSH